jgi:hypothetical protein
MCEEEREHWDYYYAYGEQEAKLIWQDLIKMDAKGFPQYSEK